jgi:hypothetical protein
MGLAQMLVDCADTRSRFNEGHGYLEQQDICRSGGVQLRDPLGARNVVPKRRVRRPRRLPGFVIAARPRQRYFEIKIPAVSLIF